MIGRWLQAWARCNRGNVTLMISLAAIPVMLAATGAIEMMGISNARSHLQAAVDAAALAGANRLSVVTTSTLSVVTEAAQQAGSDNMAGSGEVASFDVSLDQTRNSVTVTGAAKHKAIIGFFGLGDTDITAVAVADALQKAPLCILQTASGGGLTLSNASAIRAPGCLVHADGDIAVAPASSITAFRIQATGTISGPMTPAGNPGALPIADPFDGINLNPTTPCSLTVNIAATPLLSDTTLAPGVHCLPVLAIGQAHVHLLPGDHYFMGGLIMSKESTLDGDDVALIFGPTQIFQFADEAKVRLTARKSGPFAGFLIATTRSNTGTFSISSENVSNLLGTIYIPSATLSVTSEGNVGQDSAWSVIVAKKISLKNGPVLVINHNYTGSGVPVPEGVGPMSTTVLSR